MIRSIVLEETDVDGYVGWPVSGKLGANGVLAGSVRSEASELVPDTLGAIVVIVVACTSSRPSPMRVLYKDHTVFCDMIIYSQYVCLSSTYKKVLREQWIIIDLPGVNTDVDAGVGIHLYANGLIAIAHTQ
jgi:hypothetical protein